MKTTQRIYRTEKGRLVPEGDAAAAFLAYGVDDDVENRDEAAVKRILGKRGATPENKAVTGPDGDKHSDGSGDGDGDGAGDQDGGGDGVGDGV